MNPRCVLVDPCRYIQVNLIVINNMYVLNLCVYSCTFLSMDP
jgi:hypothetical protein